MTLCGGDFYSGMLWINELRTKCLAQELAMWRIFSCWEPECIINLGLFPANNTHCVSYVPLKSLKSEMHHSKYNGGDRGRQREREREKERDKSRQI